MEMKHTSKIIFFTIFALTALYFSSCNKNHNSDKYFQSNMELNVQESDELYQNQNTFLHPIHTAEKLLLFFLATDITRKNFIIQA